MEPTNSYYLSTREPALSSPSLTGTHEVDVCVVGGGIAGCSAALHLAARGFNVALLEAHEIGWGASGRSGGQVLPGYSCGQAALVKTVGRDHARRMWDLSVEAVQSVRDLINTYSINCDLQAGHLEVAVKPRQRLELLETKRELEEQYEYASLELLERPALEALVASHRYCAGLLDRDALHLHTLNYTLGLAAAARSAGAKIFEQSPVHRLEHGLLAELKTPQGIIRARFIVLCCNAYIDGLAPQLRSRIMSVGTYIVATETLGRQRIQALLSENFAVSDANFVLDYFRRTADHRLLFGGRVSYSGLHSFRIASATRRRMLNVFPQLSNAAIEFAWGGYVDITMNRAPDFGRIAQNVYYLQGFSGHGIALAGMAGKLASEAIAGHAEKFDGFSRIPHRHFPGGKALRMPALVLAMLWYRLRDWL